MEALGTGEERGGGQEQERGDRESKIHVGAGDMRGQEARKYRWGCDYLGMIIRFRLLTLTCPTCPLQFGVARTKHVCFHLRR